MTERIVPVNEVMKIKSDIAGRLLDSVNEIRHFTHYYELIKGSFACTGSNYCSRQAIILKHERDHMGQNWITYMCQEHAPNDVVGKL